MVKNETTGIDKSMIPRAIKHNTTPAYTMQICQKQLDISPASVFLPFVVSGCNPPTKIFLKGKRNHRTTELNFTGSEIQERADERRTAVSINSIFKAKKVL